MARKTFEHLEDSVEGLTSTRRSRRTSSGARRSGAFSLRCRTRGRTTTIPSTTSSGTGIRPRHAGSRASGSPIAIRTGSPPRTHEMQSERESALETVIEAARAERAVRYLDPEWVETLRMFFAPMRFAEWGISMAHQYVGRFSISSLITNPSILQVFDELRHTQRIAEWTHDLEAEHGGFGGYRTQWLNDPMFQPMREYLERVCVLRDWGEVVVATNLVLEPLPAEGAVPHPERSRQRALRQRAAALRLFGVRRRGTALGVGGGAGGDAERGVGRERRDNRRVDRRLDAVGAPLGGGPGTGVLGGREGAEFRFVAGGGAEPRGRRAGLRRGLRHAAPGPARRPSKATCSDGRAGHRIRELRRASS